MAIAITIPRLGWNMEQGLFVGWLKPDGALVRPGEALFTLESEKTTEEVECLDGGILRIPLDGPRAGDQVAVGTVIGYLVQPGEPIPERQAEIGREETGTPESQTVPAAVSECSASRSRCAISPRARRVARELGIDWRELRGSGRTGRIRERDIRAAVAKASTGPTTRHPAPATHLAVTSIRQTIAERMLHSHRSTAPVTLTTTADATNLVHLRNQFKTAPPTGYEVVPSYTDFLVRLTASALKKHPRLNARWDGDQIKESADIHIGIAVDTDAGLLVPVLRQVPSLSLNQVAARSRDLIERARQRRLTAEELQHGTFTVTNLGAFGIDAFTPIINYPECAILGVGRIQRRPVVIGEDIVARDQITLSLTFDHRIVDGAPAARFLQMLGGLIENPGPWLMLMS